MDIVEHSLLDARVVWCEFPQVLSKLESSQELVDQLAIEADVPLAPSDDIRKAVRDTLRFDGFKPTGRSKPASEYLIKAASGGHLGSINVAVDVCNVCSLHSGLPISVVDTDLLQGDVAIRVAEDGSSYVFNLSGQEIAIGNLLCLHDASGPCANAIKDSQRTKTSDTTTKTMSIVWGSKLLPDVVDKAESWYRSLLENEGAKISRAWPE